jgi:hypothetical protein
MAMAKKPQLAANPFEPPQLAPNPFSLAAMGMGPFAASGGMSAAAGPNVAFPISTPATPPPAPPPETADPNALQAAVAAQQQPQGPAAGSFASLTRPGELYPDLGLARSAVERGEITPEDYGTILQIHQEQNRPRTYSPAVPEGWQNASRKQEPVQSEKTLKKQQGALKDTRKKLTESGWRQAREAEVASVQMDEFIRQQQQQILDDRERLTGIQDELAAYRERERAEQEKLASGERDPKSLFGGLSGFGRYFARLHMFLGGADAIIAAAKMETEQQKAQASIRQNAYSQLMQTYNDEQAASNALQSRLLTLGQGVLKNYELKAKSKEYRQKAAEVSANIGMQIADLEAEREQRMQGVLQQKWQPGRAASVSGGPRPDKLAVLTKGLKLEGGGAAGDPKALERQVWDLEKGKTYVANPAEQKQTQDRLAKAQQAYARVKRLKQLYLMKTGLSPLGALPGGGLTPSSRQQAEIVYKAESRTYRNEVRSKDMMDTGVMQKHEIPLVQEMDFSKYAGISPVHKENALADFDATINIWDSKVNSLRQRLYTDPKGQNPLIPAVPNNSMVEGTR